MENTICMGELAKKISKIRWQEAQDAERALHRMSMADGIIHYSKSYAWNFHYLGINPDQQGKSILEIGPADIPALYFCTNYQGTVIEPMESEMLDRLCLEKGINRVKGSVEETSLPKCDEIWIFNVMQHIEDPDLFVSKCRAAANVIRYFEPVDYPVSRYHPHSYSADDFKRYFGEAIIYNDSHPAFHDGLCVYGVIKTN